jgi:hypothetical protein
LSGSRTPAADDQVSAFSSLISRLMADCSKSVEQV